MSRSWSPSVSKMAAQSHMHIFCMMMPWPKKFWGFLDLIVLQYLTCSCCSCTPCWKSKVIPFSCHFLLTLMLHKQKGTCDSIFTQTILFHGIWNMRTWFIDAYSVWWWHATMWYRWYWRYIGHLSSAYSPCRSSASPLQEGNKLFHMPGLAPAMYWCYPLQSWAWLCRPSGTQ